MTSDDDDPFLLEDCTPPGTVSVTPRALELAERFQASVPSRYIVAFCWFDGGRIRRSETDPWVDLGPHVDLGAYKVSDFPEKAVCLAGSLRYVVLIGQDVIEQHPQRIIDLDECGKVILKQLSAKRGGYRT